MAVNITYMFAIGLHIPEVMNKWQLQPKVLGVSYVGGYNITIDH